MRYSGQQWAIATAIGGLVVVALSMAVRLNTTSCKSMNEARFWSMIEDAWVSTGGWNQERKALAAGQLSDGQLGELVGALDDVIPSLRASLQGLNQDDLLMFDRILERKLWDIDRAEIQKFTDGSDDGFLYARGFIVAIGRDFYDAVNTTPERARMDVECEDMCYLSHQVYVERFGEMPSSGITRESASNPDGWSE